MDLTGSDTGSEYLTQILSSYPLQLKTRCEVRFVLHPCNLHVVYLSSNGQYYLLSHTLIALAN